MADAILKACSKCGDAKPLDQFNKHSGSKDGLRGYCKACHTAYSTRWIAENREHYNARIRADRAADPEKYRQWVKNYRTADPEHFRGIKRDWVLRNKERRAAIIRRYTVKHAAKLHAKVRARQAWKLLALPSWADRDAMTAFYREAKRITHETGIRHEVDHMVPLQGCTVCGLHCEANLQILPKAENLRKLNRHWPDMW
jgi:hypothetical protein